MDTKCLAAHGHRPIHPKLMPSFGPLHPVLVTSPSQTVETNKKQRKQQFPKKRNHLGFGLVNKWNHPFSPTPPHQNLSVSRRADSRHFKFSSGTRWSCTNYPWRGCSRSPEFWGKIQGVLSDSPIVEVLNNCIDLYISLFFRNQKVTHVTHDKLEVGNRLPMWRLVGLDIIFLPFVIATSLSFAFELHCSRT